ncbi:hypothetical protein L218DRAFT_948118 [Marasmius fiardii PR-910]|nr:hypothetical protein L218DRAFT_948118 [Marasmius fiardii PR-910]
MSKNHSQNEISNHASGVTIYGGSFSNVGRDQYNHCTIVHAQQEKEFNIGMGLPELSQFTEVKQGDIYKDLSDCARTGKMTQRRLSITLNFAGPFGQKKFTAKTYRGPDAMKEWHRDFLRCSDYEDWCRSSVPLLIFCGANSVRGPAGPKCWEHFGDIIHIPPPADVGFLKEGVFVPYLASMKSDFILLWTLENTGLLECATSFGSNYPQDIWILSFEGCLTEKEVIKHSLTRYIDSYSWLLQALSVFHIHGILLDEDLSQYKHLQDLNVNKDANYVNQFTPSLRAVPPQKYASVSGPMTHMGKIPSHWTCILHNSWAIQPGKWYLLRTDFKNLTKMKTTFLLDLHPNNCCQSLTMTYNAQKTAQVVEGRDSGASRGGLEGSTGESNDSDGSGSNSDNDEISSEQEEVTTKGGSSTKGSKSVKSKVVSGKRLKLRKANERGDSMGSKSRKARRSASKVKRKMRMMVSSDEENDGEEEANSGICPSSKPTVAQRPQPKHQRLPPFTLQNPAPSDFTTPLQLEVPPTSTSNSTPPLPEVLPSVTANSPLQAQPLASGPPQAQQLILASSSLELNPPVNIANAAGNTTIDVEGQKKLMSLNRKYDGLDPKDILEAGTKRIRGL